MRITTAKTAVAVTALLASAVVGVAADAVSASTASAGTSRGCTPTATLSSTPMLPAPAGFPSLTSIDVLSSSDVQIGGDDGHGIASTWRWDGRTFGAPSQFPQEGDIFTNPVATRPSSFDSDTDGWYLTGDTYGNYAEHWHGGRWTMTPLPVSPTPETEGLVVNHIEAVSGSDAWAVGYYTTAGPGVVRGVDNTGALIEHWGGTTWSIVPNPVGKREGDTLTTVRAVSADDVWAVGWGRHVDNIAYPLVEHWDGTAWHVVPAPSGPESTGLFDVSGTGSNDAWAVGDHNANGIAVPFVEHWDGTAWTEVTGLPDVGNARLDSVYAASSTNVWAIVEKVEGAGIFLHWDGRTWSTLQAPGPAALGLRYFYTALDGDGSGDVWAVGAVTDFGAIRSTLQIAHLRC